MATATHRRDDGLFGRYKARLQLKYTHGNEDVPALWIRAASGHSPPGVPCPESLCIPVTA
eukprot:8418618-Pyramimonas_sp.AAC.1